MLEWFNNMSTKEKVMMALNPSVFLIAKGTEKAIEKFQNMSDSTIDELKIESARQELLAQMSQAQAKVAQELAIATRINTAEVVEIEEFYDASGKGGIETNMTEGTISGGINAGARKVTKRVYKFTGWHEGAKEVFESQINKNEREI